MRLIFILIVFLSILGPSSESSAQIVLTEISDIHFGTLEYDATYNGQVRLGTNGALTTSGSGLVISGIGIPGQVGIAATPNDVVEIKCRKNINLLMPTGELLKATRMQGSIDTGVPYNSATLCDNLGGARAPVAVVDLAVNPTPTLLIGGRLRIKANAGLVSGTYDTGNAGGKTMRVRVIFQ